MQKKNGVIIYSASDLITFMSDPFSSFMDRCCLEFPERFQPDKADENALLVRKLGLAHEREFLDSLFEQGKDVCVINADSYSAFKETGEAMQAGREVIYQAYLQKDNFAGYADFLMRVPGESKLGNFHYEVWDSKLARKSKPYFLVQLSCYAEMIAEIQGVLPAYIAVVLGNKEIARYRLEDFYYYYLFLKGRFAHSQQNFDEKRVPDWLEIDSNSRWKSYADKLLLERDDLMQVANIRKSQVKKLKAAGVDTMSKLALCRSSSLKGLSCEVLSCLQRQAGLQVSSKGKDKPDFELANNADEENGLAFLPARSRLDVFFDMEGYPYLEGGLEYLFGAFCFNQESESEFFDWWAHDRIEEKRAFESFVDFVYERWLNDPQMHVYHYGSYEISALRRLASRHGTHEHELNELLRNEVFVDLYSIVRRSLLIGSHSYSIKQVELLYMQKRKEEVAKATDSIVYYERFLESKLPLSSWNDSPELGAIREYNRIDCESTAGLFDWLQDLRKQCGIACKLSRGSAAENGSPEKEKSEAEKLAEALLAEANGLGLAETAAESENKRVKTLLAHLLLFHTREQNVLWWEFFDRAGKSEEELIADPDCIAFAWRGSRPAESVGRSSLVYEYFFDPGQDTRLDKGDDIVFSTGVFEKAHIIEIDSERGRVLLKRSESDPTPPERAHLMLMEITRTSPLEKSIYRQAKSFQESQLINNCMKDLLYRTCPLIKGLQPGQAICADDQDLDAGIITAIENLQESYLCIQGPPGTGKTFHASRAVLHLIAQGKRIAVSSNSHKAIENFLQELGKAASAKQMRLRAVKVKNDKSGILPHFDNADIEFSKSDSKILKNIDDYQVVGATAWFFARPELKGKFDYLFVDEAGQVSLANLFAMNEVAANLILTGDQLQLEQPVRGDHPGESGLSTLEYLLGSQGTISSARGIFLNKTRRMHPALCTTVSQAFYDGRLKSDQVTEERSLWVPQGAKYLHKKSGVIYLPVEHYGNSQCSPEEVECLKGLIDELLCCRFIEKAESRNLSLKDILIVAPYNRQVRLIRSEIPGALAGSVDIFQGRERAVVVVSMAASDLASSSRGIDFLLSKKRLNVAISRAQLLAIVLGSPNLGCFSCSTVQQASLLNFYCRLMQEGVSENTENSCLLSRTGS